MSQPFHHFTSQELQGIRDLFTREFDQERLDRIAFCVVRILGLQDAELPVSEKIILVGARGDRAHGNEEDVLGYLYAFSPGLVVFQSSWPMDWPASGVILLHQGRFEVFSGHALGGLHLVRLDSISSKPPDLNDRWQALNIWSGTGPSGFGLTYAIRPELWERIQSMCRRWLTP